jgi:hypothetical protein
MNAQETLTSLISVLETEIRYYEKEPHDSREYKRGFLKGLNYVKEYIVKKYIVENLIK